MDLTSLTSRHTRVRGLITVGVVGLAIVIGLTLWWRAQASDIVDQAVAAHKAGKCKETLAALDRQHIGHRIASVGLLDDTREREACRKLIEAMRQERPTAAAELLDEYLHQENARWPGAGTKRAELLLSISPPSGGVTELLDEALKQLERTAKAEPGEEAAIRELLNRYADDVRQLLGSKVNPCDSVELYDWLRFAPMKQDAVTEPIAATKDLGDDFLLDCARRRVKEAEKDPYAQLGLEEAQQTYADLLKRYPDGNVAATARKEHYDVGSRIQRRDALESLESDSYCADPTPYRAAPAYRRHGTNKFWLIQEDRDYSDARQPHVGYTSDIDKVSLVICVSGPKRGARQQTCSYEPGKDGIRGYPNEVTFYAPKYTARAYSLRTGKLVSKFTKQLHGNPCPNKVHYATLGEYDFGPPGEIESEVSASEYRGMFDSLLH